MGIAGLLPALKSIQVTRNLSEFAGQTIAVDAYVWLHKGVYSCATELATGKPTHKYVDYAMHRVRLLRHYKIEPYIVFDGGPLPAKQGTEHGRKQRRDEYLARGKAFTSQGKHAQARECYVKSTDVTPQMAYQLIKALRAENVSYIVAPYEADAQLAYLERIGLVDGILTEDSDLLVYGCNIVLFKLDPVAATVVSVSRKDFASVSPPSSEISLVGWSDVQFRAMAILSGCDYLPSIPGIGLKTACSLLRKWKTVEQVVKALILEGKKSVPRDYLQLYEWAEKCFLHQRVYCPLVEDLVHLTDINGVDWSHECDGYVGRSIEPNLAKKVAQGEIDPVNLLLMKDINPSYIPKTAARITRPQLHGGKGKAQDIDMTTPKGGDILDFFGPNSVLTPQAITRYKCHPPVTVPRETRRGSGKRTLAQVMEQDIVSRNQKKNVLAACSPSNQLKQGGLTKSKFFMSTSAESKRRSLLPTGLSHSAEEKENVFYGTDSVPDPDRPLSEMDHLSDDKPISEVSHCADDGGELIDVDVGDEEAVKQEEGYMSPPEMDDVELSAPELSSPVRPSKRRKGYRCIDDCARHTPVLHNVEDDTDEDDFGAEPLSSPLPAAKAWTAGRLYGKWEYKKMATGIERRHSFPFPPLQHPKPTMILHTHDPDFEESGHKVQATGPSCPIGNDRFKDKSGTGHPPRNNYVSERITNTNHAVEKPEDDGTRGDHNSGTDSTPSASPETPADDEGIIPLIIDIDSDELRPADEARVKAVMDGWKARWTWESSQRRIHPPPKGSEQGPNLIPTGLASPFSSTAGKPDKQRSLLGMKRRETNVTPRGRDSLRGNRSRAEFAKLALGRRAPASPCIDDVTGEAVNEAQLTLECFW
ncbi:hypothetical protein AX15_000418 [Amanita polypyramis BW_CC]|nr:hypothetical protein AX15_000418 [Amanita polypyramis BW_CC]